MTGLPRIDSRAIPDFAAATLDIGSLQARAAPAWV